MEPFDYSADDVVGKVEVVEEVTREMVEDLLCAALDAAYGGSYYWIKNYLAHYNGRSGKAGQQIGLDYFYECLTRGGTICFIPEDYDGKDDEDNGEVCIDLEQYLIGVKLWCQRLGMTVFTMYDNHDANDADNILQLALWGKVIYG